MTRKSKRQYKDSDEELRTALQDPNAIVHHNHDGSYCIDYEMSTPERPKYRDYFNELCDVYDQIKDHCVDQGLCLLDRGEFEDFCELLYQFVPETYPESD